MTWSVIAVALGFAGLVVLFYCAFRVHLGVRRLGRELERTRRLLAPEHAALRAELSDLQGPPVSQVSGEGVRSA
ncbi:hypothetical protein ETD83_13355 [Actinomadura soli]|uniref:Uncharacterized protein n=1 Tax=Actinomadura soli TaxID=2508997 RepID=A0A5C4JDI7_9ACTN|nr:hypothetical protein [Actinomadura soli]TMR01924.1 hypothetical protein ETD83_13355 [Actinomadura soli]